MKKMNYLFAILLIGIALVSCDKGEVDDSLVNLKNATVLTSSTPTSFEGNVPVLLAVDKPKGGNVTCTDVSQAFNNVDLLCGNKVDYNNEVQFEESFPEWLNVDVEGIYISFNMDTCVKINDKYYKVGAVIVKGSNASNVYYYEGGTLSDSHLAAPGDKYMVSNLTFCFIENTQTEPIGIILKGSYWLSYSSYENNVWGDIRYTCSTGSLIYPITEPECNEIGISYYPGISSIPLLDNVGTIEVTENWQDGSHYLIITANLNEGYIWNQTSLYVGDLTGLGDLSVCPDYMNWMYQNDTKQSTHVFVVTY